jgi:hypothetical protein
LNTFHNRSTKNDDSLENRHRLYQRGFFLEVGERERERERLGVRILDTATSSELSPL